MRSACVRRRSARGGRCGPPTTVAALLLLCSAFPACASDDASCPESFDRRLEVTATAYNSLPSQTANDPALTAWGDRLEPGMRALAVSRDLIGMGLDHETQVCIEGMPGLWTVRDKMARRWKRKVDLYLGTDQEAALEFGKRRLVIRWRDGQPE